MNWTQVAAWGGLGLIALLFVAYATAPGSFYGVGPDD